MIRGLIITKYFYFRYQCEHLFIFNLLEFFSQARKRKRKKLINKLKSYTFHTLHNTFQHLSLFGFYPCTIPKSL